MATNVNVEAGAAACKPETRTIEEILLKDPTIATVVMALARFTSADMGRLKSSTQVHNEPGYDPPTDYHR
jgi:hypothetical protein